MPVKISVDWPAKSAYSLVVKVEICEGLELPFFPMRPAEGRILSRPALIKQLWHEAVDRKLWVMQPKLNGDRVCLACAGGKVYAQNRHGDSYRFKIANAKDFLALPQPFCMDGEVFKGSYYPFEVLACNGKSLLTAEAYERAALAKAMVRFIDHPWLFDAPSLDWLMRRGSNLPVYEGVVLKRWTSHYVMLGSPRQSNLEWLKRTWS